MDTKLFLGLFFAFIAATIVGTLSHEFGHYIVAKCLGYDARMNYSSTFWSSPDPNIPVVASHSIAITLGGPVQTMLTGTIGFALLLLFRNSFVGVDRLSPRQWLVVFLALFWLRPTANLFAWLGGYFVTGKFSSKGDEIEIANYYALSTWTVVTTTAIIGALILAMITFKFIPVRQRVTFLTAGLTGGVVGYVLWLVLLGKYVMP